MSLQIEKEMEMKDAKAANEQIDRILTSLEQAETYNGLFYNWYDVDTGEVGDQPGAAFISMVDNAWLVTGLRYLAHTAPESLAARADALASAINLATCYDPSTRLMYGGIDSTTGKPSSWHYGAFMSEARIATATWQ